LLILLGGLGSIVAGVMSGASTHVVAGVLLALLSIATLINMRVASTSTRGVATHPATRWGWVCIAVSLVFLALAATVRVTGVPAFERAIYEAVIAIFPSTLPWRSITRLGSGTMLFPVAFVLIALLPRQFLRHWWVWVAVMFAASTLEGFGKMAIGRPRPEALRPGFPSGHTAAAAAFYVMAAYFAADALRRRRAATLSVYAIAAGLIALVGLSRLVLRVHWPLDVIGGAALGVGVTAAAVWWHERHPAPLEGHASVMAWRHAIYRWQNVILLGGLAAVVLVRPPLAKEDTILDLAFDISGSLCIAAGVLLRLWIAVHALEGTTPLRRLPERLVLSGPYAHMRQPLPLSAVLIGVGVILLAESGPGLTLIPAALILLYRFTIPYEEAHLMTRFGPAYADYAERVPRFPLRAAIPAAQPATPDVNVMSWRSIRRELPALGTVLALTVLAEIHEFVPHLLR
jgi:undecaprenyl-diphosphatase